MFIKGPCKGICHVCCSRKSIFSVEKRLYKVFVQMTISKNELQCNDGQGWQCRRNGQIGMETKPTNL